MKRIVINKPQNIKCKICEKEISLYSFASHIKFSHQLTSDEYASKYGEFRKPKRKMSNRIINNIKCQLCNNIIPSVGMFTHLRDTHNITTDDYCIQFGEYRPSKLREYEYKQRLEKTSNKQTCVICNQEFASGNLLGGHIKRDHLLTKRNYILNYVFKRIHPVCECGCNKNVKILPYYPYKVDYVNGHNKGTLGFKFSPESKKKMSEKAIIRIQTYSGKKIDTKPELEFKSILDNLNIKYQHPYEIDLGNRKALIDFFLTDLNIPIEIDGEYWHPKKFENLNFHILPNVISDYQKLNIPNIIRIRENDVKNIKSIDDIYKFAFKHDYNINYKQKIVDKEYFKLCIDKKGDKYLKENSWLFLKFLRTFQSELPYPDLEENLSDVISKIKNYDFSKCYFQGNQKEFSNNISAVGHNYLKYYFHSYWKSKFKGNKSPTEAWTDDKIMTDVINYRIGLNNSNEIFDFSLHQMIRGLSAQRLTVSFFKPLLAASIYKHYIGDKLNPIVLDPCCGFGGRLLGFKSLYPNGKYVGCEPNIETYNELMELIRTGGWWETVQIYNCKFEDFEKYNIINNYDLIFTSIPYYDVEIYSNNIDYKSFDNWKSTFIITIEKYKGKSCFINTTEELSSKLGWNNIDTWIVSNTSHFDNSGETYKKEVIVKI